MAKGHWECLHCESQSKPRKVKGEEVCRNCGMPWEPIWIENNKDNNKTKGEKK